MKVYCEDHDLFVEYKLEAIINDNKKGDIVPHRQIVTGVYRFFPERMNESGEVFFKKQFFPIELIQNINDCVSCVQDKCVDGVYNIDDDLPF